ncbi:hypothetical protein KQI63_07440 [bacterium]|nr:hypothetical protein [bacterium]
MKWSDAYRAGYHAAKRARIAIWRRPLFAWQVAMFWKRHHSIEDAINNQLSRALWKKIVN